MLATLLYVLIGLTIRLNFVLLTDNVLSNGVGDLAECETIKHLFAICLYDKCAVNEISLLLLSLLGQDVTVISVLTLNLSCTSKLETLLCSGLSFNFWHFCFV